MTEKAVKNSINPDTIFALSTPVGGAIAIIRASGPLVPSVLADIFGGRIEPRLLSAGKIRSDKAVLDEAMAVFFPAPRSYTGEDMFELNLHGSLAVVSSVSRLLISRGLRLAEPGEFTKRAFLNGKLDLVQADAVMDVINAETERSASAALDQLGGGLSARLASIEERLIDFQSGLAAALDYPDEMEDETLAAAPETLLPLARELAALAENGRASRILRDGAKLVILGRPNAGKSSLLNALLNSDRAIVTEQAGTTRDTLEERIDLCGLPVRIVDTAGLRSDAESPVERIGIDRAAAEAKTARLVLLVFDGAAFSNDLAGAGLENALSLVGEAQGFPTLFVINKCDIAGDGCQRLKSCLAQRFPDTKSVVISTKTREGLDELASCCAALLGASETGALVTNERHIDLLLRASGELFSAAELYETELISELVASALAALSEVTGREFSNELLDRIFSRFCVGK